MFATRLLRIGSLNLRTLNLKPSRQAALIALSWICASCVFASEPAQDGKPALAIKRGAHVSVIGNTLADRMQHDGWLETLLQARFPGQELVFRDMGYSGDELTIRLRSANFGSPDKWLAKNKTDVVIACFGYNESYGDLQKFKSDLSEFVKHTLGQKYNGVSAPKLVLCTPIAQEEPLGRDLPDPKEHNERLAEVTKLIADEAKVSGVAFVDLFNTTKEAYSKAKGPLTINGIHLNHEGNRIAAELIDGALFGKPIGLDKLEKIRKAVLAKNFVWFNRYRTVDGYSIFGGRADLSFVAGQTNRVVMDREMEILDQMTANRDKAIWAAALGQEIKVDDSNTSPFIPVVTNKPGAGPNGTHLFLSGEEEIAKMTLGKGLKVNLFASEKEFPELAKPVQMSFDSKGRLWAAVWPSYPHWKPKDEMNDKIVILEDTNADGKADTIKTFADGLHCPTGFEIANGGVYVAQAPDIMFLKDTDGDDKADVRERVLSGLDSADTHHTSNSFRLDPGGALYFQEGTFHHTQVETPYGPVVRCANAGVYRYEPRSQKFEVYVSFPFANPHGHSFDRWGQDFVTDGTGNVNYYATAFSGHVDYPDKHRGMRPFFDNQGIRPCPGTEVLASRHFPDDYQGNYLVANVIGFQGILRYKVREEESGFVAERQEDFLSASDPSFRPSDLETGPDGALYFLDWQNPIIGHMQHNLRDPSRDQVHGRIYRVTYEGRELLHPPALDELPTEKLLDVLKSPEDRLRYRAKIELSARDPNKVLPALGKWIANLNHDDPEFEHHLLEGLWLHQFFDAADAELLGRVLASPNYRARAAATRVLCYWRDKIPNALELLKKAAADPYPRVRLEAVRPQAFLPNPMRSRWFSSPPTSRRTITSTTQEARL